MNAIAENYIATWNERDPQRRADLLSKHWAPDCLYVDPLAVGEGREGMSGTIEAVHGQFPDFAFTLLGDADAHHRQLRFQWGLGPVGAEPVVVGFDVVVVDDDDRIADVRGFLDKVPA
ncbi:nuclear transport factor 2 family protein [Nocardioides sp. GXZ039]|uniref:nuclear transport factor 2 family protein n=1 Tax=Nocardioides sp. GXZ039 TaxID=3136018 RepID=UPI0030F3FC0B